MSHTTTLCLIHLTLGIGLISCLYMSTEKLQQLNTPEGGAAVTEVEGYGPSGPVDQEDPGQTPLEVHLLLLRQMPGYYSHSLQPLNYPDYGLARLASTEVNTYLARLV